jgi:chromosome segregation ATPase
MWKLPTVLTIGLSSTISRAILYNEGDLHGHKMQKNFHDPMAINHASGILQKEVKSLKEQLEQSSEEVAKLTQKTEQQAQEIASLREALKGKQNVPIEKKSKKRSSAATLEEYEKIRKRVLKLVQDAEERAVVRLRKANGQDDEY